MKTHLKIAPLVLFFSLLSLEEVASQKILLNPEEFTGPTHIAKEDFPKGNVINMVYDWGGLAVVINEPAVGTDYTPVY